MNTPPLILASASPRRKQLLTEAGYKFDIIPSKVDESTFPSEGIRPIQYAKNLALQKAKDVAKKHPRSLVLGADTVADFQGRIIGKPRDENHAEEIIKMLFKNPHKVITGIALVCEVRKLQIVDADSTTVHPRKLTDSQIAAHIASRIWKDKAGAYAIKKQDDPFVDHIEGSLTNVMGLPLELLQTLLRTLNSSQ